MNKNNCKTKDYFKYILSKEKGTPVNISGHTSVTLSQICNVYDNDMDKTSFIFNHKFFIDNIAMQIFCY